jgi:hypothetical protein
MHRIVFYDATAAGVHGDKDSDDDEEKDTVSVDDHGDWILTITLKTVKVQSWIFNPNQSRGR